MGLIDWDFAYPAPAWDDVTYALRFVAPFVDEEQAVGVADAPVDAVVDDVVSRLTRTIDLVARLAADQREPQVTWVAKGYLDRLREQESWIGSHQDLFLPL